MSRAPAMPVATPRALRAVMRSPSSRAAMSMTTMGVSVAMSEKYTGLV